MRISYPVLIHKDEGSCYGVTIPHLPGCFSAGDTVQEALDNSREAILLHIEGLLADHESVPIPSQPIYITDLGQIMTVTVDVNC